MRQMRIRGQKGKGGKQKDELGGEGGEEKIRCMKRRRGDGEGIKEEDKWKRKWNKMRWMKKKVEEKEEEEKQNDVRGRKRREVKSR